MKRIIEMIEKEFDKLSSIDQKVEFLNAIRGKISELSPFEEPVDCGFNSL